MILEGEFLTDERVRKEALTLINRNINVKIACFVTNLDSEKGVFNGVEIYRIKIPRLIYKTGPVSVGIPVYSYYCYRHLKRILRNEQVDILHLHDLPLLRLAIYLSRNYNKKLVVDLHENRPEIMKLYRYVNKFPGKIVISIRRWSRYQKKYLNKIDNLILVTPEAESYYREMKYVNEKCKVAVIPNYPSLKYLNSISIKKEIIEKYQDKFSVIYLGDTSLRRGTMDLLKAAESLKELSNIKFIILGTSREHDILKQFVYKNKLDNVELLGYINFELALRYIAASSIGVSPLKRNIHHDTTYAAKIFNYMYFSKPVIVSNCTAQSNIVNKYKLGLTFKADDYKELAEKILQLKDDSNKYQEFSRNAKKYVTETLNWEKIEPNLISVYDFK